MKSSATALKYYLVPFFVWITIIGFVLIFTDREALHLQINQWHHPILDVFFKYTTYLGEELFIGSVIFLGLIKRIRFGVIGLIGIIGAGIFTQLLKRQVFFETHRPAKVFEAMADLHFVEGVQLHHHFSFPSGHATAAFSTFLFLALLAKRPLLQIICFILATLVGFSRVYLSQHFLEDVYAGSIIGVVVLFSTFLLLKEKKWGQKGLLDSFDRKS